MLGEILTKLRKSRKIRQEDMAKIIGVARTTYGMYEQGHRHPDYETLQKLADFFDVKIDYLLGRSDDASPSDNKDKSVNRAFLKLPEDTTEEEKEFLQAQVDLQLEIFRKLKSKK